VIDVILQRGSRDAGFREQLRSMLSSPA